MAKCPWCGKDMLAYVFSRGWAARCPNVDCPAKLFYATPDKALAAASKRFMPKMTVKKNLFTENLSTSKNHRKCRK